jgi:hypothetical protein
MRPIALALAVVALAGGAGAAAAQAQFNARPTTPYECASLADARGGDGIWTGWFSGRKENVHGDDGGSMFGRYDDTRRRACFVSERECRNWLYNMQSEYTYMVWRAECRPGLAR